MMFIVTRDLVLYVQDHIGVGMIKRGEARPATREDIKKYKDMQRIDEIV